MNYEMSFSKIPKQKMQLWRWHQASAYLDALYSRASPKRADKVFAFTVHAWKDRPEDGHLHVKVRELGALRSKKTGQGDSEDIF